jgi:hypothetical protein
MHDDANFARTRTPRSYGGFCLLEQFSAPPLSNSVETLRQLAQHDIIFTVSVEPTLEIRQRFLSATIPRLGIPLAALQRKPPAALEEQSCDFPRDQKSSRANHLKNTKPALYLTRIGCAAFTNRTLWIPTSCECILSGIIPSQVCSLLEIGDTMRILLCLLLQAVSKPF